MYITIRSHDKIGGEVPLNTTGPRLALEILVDNIRLWSIHIDLFHHAKLDAFTFGKLLDFRGTSRFLQPELQKLRIW
jgi:hypothetical protein